MLALKVVHVRRMYDGTDAAQLRGDAAERARLRGVRMNDIRSQPIEHIAEADQRLRVAERRDGPNHGNLDHVDAPAAEIGDVSPETPLALGRGNKGQAELPAVQTLEELKEVRPRTSSSGLEYLDDVKRRCRCLSPHFS